MSETTSGWSGRVVTTTTNPSRLAPANNARRAWRAYALDVAASAGRVGYSNILDQAYIPMPPDTTFPIGSAIDEGPCENNELWFHGAIGSTIGFGEA